MITEVLYDPLTADEDREWIELANVGGTTAALDGYGLGDEEQEGGPEGMLRFPPGAILPPGEALVVARSARGFRSAYGHNPAFEIVDSDPAVANMLPDRRWGRGQLQLANDGDEVLLLDPVNHLVDALSYGDKATFFDPALPTAVRGQSLARMPAACDSDEAVDWQVQAVPSPGAIQLAGACREAQPASAHLPIGAIQGMGDVSPYLHQFVTFSGQVTGTMEDRNAAGVIYYTLFVQDVAGWEDGDAATSDGIAVFLGRRRPTAVVGERVRVRGRVTEFYGLTEIDDRDLFIEVQGTAGAAVMAEILQLPVDPVQRAQYLEAREGMLVSAPAQAVVLGPTHSGCGFALAARANQERPFARDEQGAPAPAILVQNASDIACETLPQVKTGDTVDLVRGPLTYHFEQYKVVVQNAQRLRVSEGTLPQIPLLTPLAGEQYRVATLNLEDYLAPAAAGLEDPERPSPDRLAIKRAKLVRQITDALGCPTLLAVQEVETAALLQELASELLPECGYTYQISHHDSADVRGIDVALLSDPRRVTVTGVALRQHCTSLETDVLDPAVDCPLGEYPLFSRPPLEVSLLLDNEPLLLWVVHLKSKRGGVAETAPRRLAQSAFLHSLAVAVQQTNPRAAYMVLGDINDMDQSPSWQALLADGVLLDALGRVPAAKRYSYIFDGMSQLIDGIFVSPALAAGVSQAAIVHVNSDFPAGWATDMSPGAISFRASDHDAPVITIGLAPSPTRALSTAVPRSPVQATAAPTPPAAAPPTTVPPAPTPVIREIAVAPNMPELPTPAPGPAPAGQRGTMPLIGAALLTAVALLLAAFWRRRH